MNYSHISVMDVETTGLDPTIDRIVEVAAVHIAMSTKRLIPGGSGAVLVNPGIPIPPTASAIHHLTDDDVIGCLSPDKAIDIFRPSTDVVCAAHNARFDQSFLQFPISICTKKLAYRLWPEAPAHSNQVLRYWKGIQFTRESQRAVELPPHRALHDAFVTAHLLTLLLDEIDWDIDLAIEISEAPSLLPTVTFGKHAGLRWENVPKDYLRWVAGQDFDDDVKHTAFHWLNA